MGAGASNNFQPPVGGNGKGGQQPVDNVQQVMPSPGIGGKGSRSPEPPQYTQPGFSKGGQGPVVDPRPEPIQPFPIQPMQDIAGGMGSKGAQVEPRPEPVQQVMPPQFQRRADRFQRMLNEGRMNPQQYQRRMARLNRRFAGPQYAQPVRQVMPRPTAGLGSLNPAILQRLFGR